MVSVKFTRHLVRFFPELAQQNTTSAAGHTVAEVVADLDRQYPGLGDYIIDERGRLRKHVNIFVGEELIEDRLTLSDPVAGNDQLYIYQALSGG